MEGIMKIKNLIIQLGIILLLLISVACQNKNSDLEKKIKDLEKQNEEILKKQQEQQKILRWKI